MTRILTLAIVPAAMFLAASVAVEAKTTLVDNKAMVLINGRYFTKAAHERFCHRQTGIGGGSRFFGRQAHSCFGASVTMLKHRYGL
jgi:hypothetical protein